MGNALKIALHFRDLYNFQKALKELGDIPQKAVTKAAGKAATQVRREIRGEVPVRTGTLKRGIIRHGEKPSKKGKKVYDLYFDPALNKVFQRPIKQPGIFGGNTKNGYAYYPSSMEYGFLTRSKGGGYDYVPGYHFMRQGTEKATPSASEVVRKAVIDETVKVWKQKR